MSVIYVERESQKGIIIGHQGKALKKKLLPKHVKHWNIFSKNLSIWKTFVKVDKDWRSSDKELKNFGYQLD